MRGIMSRIVILGQSSGVFELVQRLRQAQPSAEIVVFSLDGQLPHDQSRLADFLGKTISKDQVVLADRDFYRAQNIELILDQKLDRISLRQKKLTTEAKEHIKFDALVIADAPEVRWPEIRGIQKQGVFHARTLGAAEAVYKQLGLSKSVVIQIHDWEDIRVALALKAWGKEVSVIVPHETRLARMVEHDVCEAMIKSFAQETWNVYYGMTIAEVLGDADVKAVRLSSGKVLAADMIILGEVEPRLRMFEDFVAPQATAIAVNASLEAQAPSVYAFGDVANDPDQPARYWPMTRSDAEVQARLLAGVLTGHHEASADPQTNRLIYALDLPGWSLGVYGDISPTLNVISQRSWNAEARLYQKMFTRDEKVYGAILVNSKRVDVYEYLMSDRPVVSGCEKQIFQEESSLESVKAALAGPRPVEDVDAEAEDLWVDAPSEHPQSLG